MEEQEVYKALTERVGAPESVLLPKIWRLLVTPREGRMLLELPSFPEDLADKFSMDLADVHQQIEEWVVKGVVIPFIKEGREKYGLCRGAVNFFESASHVAHRIVGDELLDLWGEWLDTEWLEICRAVEQPTARVLPHADAVEDDTSLLPAEDIWARVDQAERIAAVECPCRLTLKRCNHTLECCLLFDRGAELAIRRGSGSELTKEQTYELIRSCVTEGLIPSGGNRAKLTNLCLCCTDCCLTHVPHLSHGYPMLLPSRYLSVPNGDLCSGCGTCVEMCPYEAVVIAEVPGSREQRAVVDPEKCFGCGVCVPNCPEEALALKLVRPPEHLPPT
jgi:electron transport complex protein RnfB